MPYTSQSDIEKTFAYYKKSGYTNPRKRYRLEILIPVFFVLVHIALAILIYIADSRSNFYFLPTFVKLLLYVSIPLLLLSPVFYFAGNRIQNWLFQKVFGSMALSNECVVYKRDGLLRIENTKLDPDKINAEVYYQTSDQFNYKAKVMRKATYLTNHKFGYRPEYTEKSVTKIKAFTHKGDACYVDVTKDENGLVFNLPEMKKNNSYSNARCEWILDIQIKKGLFSYNKQQICLPVTKMPKNKVQRREKELVQFNCNEKNNESN